MKKEEYEKSTKEIVKNLKKAQTHSAKVVKMLEEGKYCIDIMQQNMAVIGLLKLVNQQILERHLHSCFKFAMEANDEEMKNKMINEILKVNKLSGK